MTGQSTGSHRAEVGNKWGTGLNTNNRPMEIATCTCTDSTARAGNTVTEYNVEGLREARVSFDD